MNVNQSFHWDTLSYVFMPFVLAISLLAGV